MKLTKGQKQTVKTLLRFSTERRVDIYETVSRLTLEKYLRPKEAKGK